MAAKKETAAVEASEIVENTATVEDSEIVENTES